MDLGLEVLQWVRAPSSDLSSTLLKLFVASLHVANTHPSLRGGPSGSLAAAFQSFIYGGLTPAGGIFATLTSMAMLGTLMWPAVIVSIFLATGVAAAVWAAGVGR